MRLPALASIALLAALPALPQTEALQLSGVRFWSFQDFTRVAIEINGEFRYSSDRIANPDRIYFDLYGTKPHLDKSRVSVREVNDQFLKRVRVAETVPGVTRIVLDQQRSDGCARVRHVLTRGAGA